MIDLEDAKSLVTDTLIEFLPGWYDCVSPEDIENFCREHGNVLLVSGNPYGGPILKGG